MQDRQPALNHKELQLVSALLNSPQDNVRIGSDDV